MNGISSNLKKQIKELILLFRILIRAEYKINSNYYMHSNYFVYILMIIVLVLFPISEDMKVGYSNSVLIPVLLVDIVLIGIYYMVCIEMYLKLKSLQDNAKNGILEVIPISFQKESCIRFIVINSKIDVDSIIMQNIESNSRIIDKKIKEESLKMIDSLSKEEKKAALKEYLEKSVERLFNSVLIINSIVLIYIFITIIKAIN